MAGRRPYSLPRHWSGPYGSGSRDMDTPYTPGRAVQQFDTSRQAVGPYTLQLRWVWRGRPRAREATMFYEVRRQGEEQVIATCTYRGGFLTLGTYPNYDATTAEARWLNDPLDAEELVPALEALLAARAA